MNVCVLVLVCVCVSGVWGGGGIRVLLSESNEWLLD